MQRVLPPRARAMPPAEMDDGEEEPYLPEDDESDGELEAQFPMPVMQDTLDKAIVVDGLPQVPPEKYEKLLKVLEKIFTQLGPIAEDGIMMPKDENGLSKGFAFVEYATKEGAEEAIKKTQGHKLDKNHTFVVNTFVQVNEYLAVPEEAPAIVPPEYEPKEDLNSWLLDNLARDQYVIRWADNTEIYWNDPGEDKLEPVYGKRGWTDTYVMWSPQGRYLACFHRLGIILFGGPSWKKLMKFGHEGVKLIDFSPSENFLVTWSPLSEQSQSVIVWDAESGAKLRAFPGPKEIGQMAWPIFKWSHKDTFLARLGDDCIHVYESASMKLLKDRSDKRTSIKVDAVKDFAWCPADDRMAYWVPEIGNAPARVTIMDLPSREELRQKNLFNLHECRLNWHPQGDFLAVKVDRHTKTKKTIYTTFELFRVRDRNVAIEVLELEPKETRIIAFAWEPKGVRFALISGDGPAKFDVSFYTMETTKGTSKVRLLTKLEKRSANTLYWSPQGGTIVLAGLGQMAGELEWYNVNEMQTMGADEHFMCTDVDWDPTGRYLTTGVSHWRHQSDNGYNVWSSQGKLLGRHLKDKFYALLWRPRPPSLLSDDQEREVRKNLRDYSRRFEAEDNKLKYAAEIEKLRARKQMKRDFYATVEAKLSAWRAQKAERIALRNGVDSEDEDLFATSEEIKETVLKTVEQAAD
mmetsp:Transcript_28808/g.84433  ORF Transcript_28808/g.84433 Transcript_28808/m.84433 type:complete len:691 (+) Transcript_28808:11-2083(+)